MKHIIAAILILLIGSIDGIEKTKTGYYISTDNMPAYRIMQPLEAISNNYIQVDCSGSGSFEVIMQKKNLL